MTSEHIRRLAEDVAEDLLDLDDAIRAARDLVARAREAFDHDEMLRLAAEAISNRLGEAAGRLDPAWKATVPEVPRRVIRDNRNFVVHAYRGIDDDQLWSTLAVDVPALGRLLEPHVGRARATINAATATDDEKP